MVDASPSTTRNIITEIKADHARIKSLWDSFDAATDNKSKQGIADKIIATISIHDSLEMTFFYPLLRRYGGEKGNKYADDGNVEHDKIRWSLYELDQSTVDKAGYEQKMHTTLKELFNHIGEEEKEILPFLAQKAPKEVLERYGTMFSSMKWAAPTRPHPVAGSVEGLPQAAAGMLAKPIDEATRLARELVGSKVPAPSTEEKRTETGKTVR